MEKAESCGQPNALFEAQCWLTRFGAVGMVFHQMSQPWHHDQQQRGVFDELIATAVSLLDEGNLPVQNTFLYLFGTEEGGACMRNLAMRVDEAIQDCASECQRWCEVGGCCRSLTM